MSKFHVKAAEARSYSIIKSQRIERKTTETVIDSGLSWDAASERRKQLQEAERRAHPEQTSWTIALYIIQLETLKEVEGELTNV